MSDNIKDLACVECGQPFILGKNIFTKSGLQEMLISALCEKCFHNGFDGDLQDTTEEIGEA